MTGFNAFWSDWLDTGRDLGRPGSVFAIGDVHGCLTHFDAMLAAIARLRAERGTPAGDRLVLLGDYIDRGPDSLGVLARVAALAVPDVAITRLLGNHDFFLALAIGQEPVDFGLIDAWTEVGGRTTLRELGITPDALHRMTFLELRKRLRAALGSERALLLTDLAFSERIGGYLFVHAGIEPATPLEEQDPVDQIMIREPFLTGAGWAHDFTVVHGHSIRGHECLPHRIAVDSGAFRSGVLTAVELSGTRMRFIAVTRDATLDAIATLKRDGPAVPHYEGPVALGPDA